MTYQFTYGGIVESNKDPLKLGRMKVRVPHVYGSSITGSGYIPVNDLPWALPAGLPAGGSAKSGGFSQLPEIGDKVWVRFLDGEPEKPIWEWGMQSVDDRDTLKLHKYGTGIPVGSPERTVWTRYGHALEINEGAIIATTSQGYRIMLTDASGVGNPDGNITIATPLGNMLKLDDLDSTLKVLVLEEIYFTALSGVSGFSNSFNWRATTGNIDFESGGQFTATATSGISLHTTANIDVDALGSSTFSTAGNFTMAFSSLKLGLAAVEPAVLGARLVTFLESLLVWLSAHIHTSATPGAPTSPPTIPPIGIVAPLPEMLISTTVTIQS